LPLVELRNVTKSFGNVAALQPLNFVVHEGEVVSLVGDNGAGKSTLIKILAGVHKPDSGEIYYRGQRMDKWDAATARRAGIETVYQDKALAENQTIARNIFMGRESTDRLGFIKIREQTTEAARLMRTIGFTSKVFSPDSVVQALSGGERQGVAIARALYFKAQLIVLDEPTAALSLAESEEVLRFVRRIKEGGSSAIFISHNLYHAYDVGDRLVILDRGRIDHEIEKKTISVGELIETLQKVARGGKSDSRG
jgi:simple sugar transport system ATP-binding protein